MRGAGSDCSSAGRPDYHDEPLIQSARAEASRWPDLFIIGAPKSGTTSLYEYLMGHPQVFMSRLKEPGYFSPDVPRRQEPFTYARDEARYLALFAGASEGQRAGEASTQYLFSRRAPELIKEHQADPRIIVMLRNPVDMAYSMHGQRVSMGVDQIEDFEAALAADQQPGFGGSPRKETIERAGTYRERARSGEQLERWLTVFRPEAIHAIVFEDFRRDTAAEFRRVLEFLGVDPGYQPETFAVHNPRHRERHGLSRTVLRNPISRWLAQTALPRTVGTDRTARGLRRIRMSRLNVSHASRPPLDGTLRARLEKEFGQDVERLSRLVGRDLSELWFGRDP